MISTVICWLPRLTDTWKLISSFRSRAQIVRTVLQPTGGNFRLAQSIPNHTGLACHKKHQQSNRAMARNSSSKTDLRPSTQTGNYSDISLAYWFHSEQLSNQVSIFDNEIHWFIHRVGGPARPSGTSTQTYTQMRASSSLWSSNSWLIMSGWTKTNIGRAR